MATSNNTLGFGSLASVAWSDMTGTDLTASELQAVNAEIQADSTIYAVLLGVIREAVKVGWSSFRLSDIASDYFQATDLSPNPPDTASDWADFINQVSGRGLSASTELSLAEWRRVAADLQDHASLQASKRHPDGEGGGIKSSNGNWFINGQEVSLLDAYMAVRVNQVANFDDSLNVYIAELNQTNKLIKAANAFLGLLRERKPVDSDQDAGISVAELDAFEAEWGVDPLSVFLPDLQTGSITNDGYYGRINATYGLGTTITDGSKKWDVWIDNVKGYVDTKNTESQTVQQKLEQMTNRRSEVLDGLTSFSKSQTQTGAVFARNLG